MISRQVTQVMSTPLIGKVSVHGNDEENYELMKGAWVHVSYPATLLQCFFSCHVVFDAFTLC